MKKSILSALMLSTLGISAFAQSGNVGIGTNSPGTKLDVNGAITNRETSVAVSGNAASVPANVSQVQLTGAATAVIVVNAPSAPNAGQRLILYNNTTGSFSATLNGSAIPVGKAMEFAYSNGGWQATNGGGITGDYDWMKSGNTFPNSPGDTAQNVYHIGGNVGIGTNTPNSTLDLGPGVASTKLAVYNNTAGTDFYGLGLSGGLMHFHAASATPSTAPDMVLHSTGQLGINIGVTNPTANLDVNGTARIRNTPTPPLGYDYPLSPMYVDPSGNVVKSRNGDGDMQQANTVLVNPGDSVAVYDSIPDGRAFKLQVAVSSGCAYVAIAEFWVLCYSGNNQSALMGIDGVLSSNGAAPPTFTETQKTSTVTWTGLPSCSDGMNSTGFNFRAVITDGIYHRLYIKNNGNIAKAYSIKLEEQGVY